MITTRSKVSKIINWAIFRCKGIRVTDPYHLYRVLKDEVHFPNDPDIKHDTREAFNKVMDASVAVEHAAKKYEAALKELSPLISRDLKAIKERKQASWNK